jgi:hypothetical protein
VAQQFRLNIPRDLVGWRASAHRRPAGLHEKLEWVVVV